MPAEADERLMRRALGTAGRARGVTSASPLVGAVIVADGVVIGEGFHEAAGRPHAETVALAASGHHARGATLYVTLEPCVHHGRTPPCAPAVVAAGAPRLRLPTPDPAPPGGGHRFPTLRAAGRDPGAGRRRRDGGRPQPPASPPAPAARAPAPPPG